jgi:hypothetical protein
MQSDPPASSPRGRSRRRIIAVALVALLVVGAAAGAVIVAVRPPWLHDVKITLQQVPVIGQLPGIVPESTGLPTPPPVRPGATPNATFAGSADTIPLRSRPEFAYEGDLPWQIHGRSEPGRLIEGYASAPSYLPGETLELAVSTTAASYSATIWRVSGAEPADSPFVEVARIGAAPGRLQAQPVVDPATKMVRAPWAYSTTFAIPADWPSGMYLVRLDSDQGSQSYVPFALRSKPATRFLVVSSALNWQAYNDWGGSSLYVTRVGDPMPGVNRALAVSFDRPYAQDGGAGQLFFLELPLISWLERQGLDLSYTTDYDLSIDPGTQPLPGAVVFNGHAEYWGIPLLEWLETHVNLEGDIGLGVFAADTGYWPITLGGDEGHGPRIETCYKNGPLPPSVGASQPLPSSAPIGTETPGETPVEVAPGVTEEETGLPISSFPAGGPYVGHIEVQPLMGLDYLHVTTEMARFSLAGVAPDPALLAGTELTGGSSLGFIAGGEVDGVYHDARRYGPDGGRFDRVFAQAANIPARQGESATAQAVYRDLPNGGRVFASGTFYWGWALDPAFAAGHDVSRDFGRLTRNVLDWLAKGR